MKINKKLYKIIQRKKIKLKSNKLMIYSSNKINKLQRKKKKKNNKINKKKLRKKNIKVQSKNK